MRAQDTSAEVPAPPEHDSAGSWSVQQLTGFLAMVSSAEDERTASRVAVERAADALDADIAALVSGGEVVASVGLNDDPLLIAALAEVADGRTSRLMAPGLTDRPALAITVEPETPSRLVLAREETRDFSAEETYLARGMAHALSLSLRMFRLAAEERRQRREAEMQSELTSACWTRSRSGRSCSSGSPGSSARSPTARSARTCSTRSAWARASCSATTWRAFS